MAEGLKDKNIGKIFNNMEYGHNFEDTSQILEWFKNRSFALDDLTESPNVTHLELKSAIQNETLCTIHVPDVDTIKNILKKDNNRKWAEEDPLQRSKIIDKIGSEIIKYADQIAQLEAVTRGILVNDTKTKALPLLAHYFHYYSTFAYLYGEEIKLKSQSRIAVGIISNENFLAHFGLFIAPTLAAGYNIIIQVGSQLAPVAFLLCEIGLRIGLPENVIKIIPSDDGELGHYMESDKVQVVTLLADLNSNKYHGVPTLDKKLLVLTSYKTPVIIFDNADLDAACEGVIESSWSYQSMLPWSTDTILVQENILQTFLHKLKLKLRSLQISTALDKSAGIAVNANDKNKLARLNKLVNKAALQGIEIFQAGDVEVWSPTIFIGGNVVHNAMSSNEDEGEVVTILPFRSIEEAISLANNNKQGLWASIWCENGGVVNEVIRKLQVSNISVNGSYGYSAETVLTPTKASGIGKFGGREGFLEYFNLEYSVSFDNNLLSTQSVNVDSVVNAAKKAQESWQRTPTIQKQKAFQEFAENLEGKSEKEWSLKHVYGSISGLQRYTAPSTISGRSLSSMIEPRGVIVVDTSESMNAQLVLSSIFEGNSLIVLNTDAPILKLLSSKLPPNVLTLVANETNVIKNCLLNTKVSCCFGDNINGVFEKLKLQDCIKYLRVSNSIEDIYGKIVVVKNVWSDIGKSSNCNF